MIEFDIYEKLNKIFHDVFDDNLIVLTPKTSAADIDGWDSLAHIDLVVAIEAAFGVRFTSAELETMNQVGDIVMLVQEKQKL
jgi:acyl carrier protein